jgi:hypothetical protein
MAGLVLLQTAILVVTQFIVRQKLQEVDQVLQSVSRQSVKGMKMIYQAIDGVEEVLSKLPAAQQTIARIVETLVEKAETVNRAIGRGVDLVRYQAFETEHGLDALLSMLSQRVYKTHKTVSHPSLRLATIIRSGIDALKWNWLQNDRSPVSNPPEDEDEFV